MGHFRGAVNMIFGQIRFWPLADRKFPFLGHSSPDYMGWNGLYWMVGAPHCSYTSTAELRPKHGTFPVNTPQSPNICVHNLIWSSPTVQPTLLQASHPDLISSYYFLYPFPGPVEFGESLSSFRPALAQTFILGYLEQRAVSVGADWAGWYGGALGEVSSPTGCVICSVGEH